jgi:hypothetical protein
MVAKITGEKVTNYHRSVMCEIMLIVDLYILSTTGINSSIARLCLCKCRVEGNTMGILIFNYLVTD